MMRPGESGTVAVFDVGKTNIKLSAVSRDGTVLETLSMVNPVLPGPPWQHHDLKTMRSWLLDGLRELATRHGLQAFAASGHGSGGMLVREDPDHGGDGMALPMIDYEQALPEDIRAAYEPLSGTFLDRGSATMMGATHQARQLFWMEERERQAFAQAHWFLGIPQYWAWVLSGVAVSETSILGAQSHLWNVAEKRWAPIVRARGWQALMPPFAPAWKVIGHVRESLAERYGLPRDLQILTGGHDSSLNYYRYQAAGLRDVSVISTGTWIVGLSDRTPVESLDEHRGMTCNSDVFERPLGGVLSMGGREYAAIAGADAPDAPTELATIARLIERGTMALPTFGSDDGLFPGSAGKGRFAGPAPATPEERKALAVLHCTLLTVECLDALGPSSEIVLDGTFLREPVYAAMVAALQPERRVRYNLDAYGIASGAALLAGHETRTSPATVELRAPDALGAVAEPLTIYAARWRDAARAQQARQGETA